MATAIQVLLGFLIGLAGPVEVTIKEDRGPIFRYRRNEIGEWAEEEVPPCK